MPKRPEEEREESNLSEVVERLQNNDFDFGDTKEERLAAGQRAHDYQNEQEDLGNPSIEGIQMAEQSSADHVEEIYPDAADDSVEVYRWGDGEDARTFVLEDSREMVDQENAFRSRKIISEAAEYHLLQEKEDGDTYVSLEVEGDPMFGVNSQGDFEDKWQELQGYDSQIGEISALDDNYAGSSEHHNK